jgi:eukaryotic-like serine/threonine-protein kinase
VASRGTDPLKPVTQLVPTLPTSLQKAIRRALALNSDDRFATVDEFWQAVLAHPVGVSSPAPVVAPSGFPTQQSVVGAFVHLPAVATPRTPLHRRIRRTKRPYAVALSLVGFAVFALLAGFVFKASFWSTGGSLDLSTPTAIVQSECKATISPTGTTVISPSMAAAPQSSCKVIITPITGPTVTSLTPGSTVTAPTPGPTATLPTPGPIVVHPST